MTMISRKGKPEQDASPNNPDIPTTSKPENAKTLRGGKFQKNIRGKKIVIEEQIEVCKQQQTAIKTKEGMTFQRIDKTGTGRETPKVTGKKLGKTFCDNPGCQDTTCYPRGRDIHEIPSTHSKDSKGRNKSGKVRSFNPQPYVFRLPAGNNSTNCRYTQVPPFWLLLDHTIAVIWTIFSPEFKNRHIDIHQLQWALEFLKSIKSRRGERPKDVALCIEILQDRILSMYADMSPALLSEDCDPSVCGGKASKSFSGPREPCCGVPKEVYRGPISVTYDDIMQNCPASVQQLFKGSSFNTQADGKSSFHTLGNLGLKSSQDELTGFLEQWRNDQLQRIQFERQQLQKLEKYLCSNERNLMALHQGGIPLDAKDSKELERKTPPRLAQSEVKWKHPVSEPGS